jgi:hypothetical protein
MYVCMHAQHACTTHTQTCILCLSVSLSLCLSLSLSISISLLIYIKQQIFDVFSNSIVPIYTAPLLLPSLFVCAHVCVVCVCVCVCVYAWDYRYSAKTLPSLSLYACVRDSVSKDTALLVLLFILCYGQYWILLVAPLSSLARSIITIKFYAI